MTYTPKPGDRVTSPLLVGEWTVGSKKQPAWWEVYDDKGNALEMYVENLTPVAPPLPPEPAVGSVVRAHGQLWLRTDHTHALHWADGDGFSEWCDVAAAPDLSPVVAVDDVAEWMYGDDDDDKFPDALIQEFRDDFGGWGE